MLFDYRRAFDLIDHTILVTKLSELDIPISVVNWIIAFLLNRSQCVKLAEVVSPNEDQKHQESFREQNQVSGFSLFVLMI